MTATKKRDEPKADWTLPECQQIALALNLLTTLRAALGVDVEEERAARTSALAKLVTLLNAHRDLVRDTEGKVVAKITRTTEQEVLRDI